MTRKQFLTNLGSILTPLTLFPNSFINTISRVNSNFRKIYSNDSLKKEFYKFLKNVFNLYPENDLHQLISKSTIKYNNDKDIYINTQSKLTEITVSFSLFRNKLPALFKQKEEMAKQTLELIGEKSTYNGYLEIGSSGRYLDYLEERVKITGKRYYADGKKPGYSIPEMVDRGQITIGAEYIPLTDYDTDYSKIIKDDSLDLVTIYIGFHHCPVNLRTTFISSIRNTLRNGGKLILRDHDCNNENQKTMVALAHDVFNMGTEENWEYNSKEIRNFYSLNFICQFIEEIGFKFEKRTLFQDGDPTKNALMLFTKI